MLNLKQTRMLQTIAAVAVLTLAGCDTTSSHDERSEGRVMDDEHITERVREDLKREPVYKFETVDVSTFAGVVQLSGFVNSDHQKQRAAEIARQVPGVREVHNGIALKPELQTPTGGTNAAPRIYSE